MQVFFQLNQLKTRVYIRFGENFMGLETLIAASSLWLFGKYHSKFVEGLLNFLKESGLNSSDLAKWAKYGWTLAPVKYDNRVRELYSKIFMVGQPNPVPLEGMFTDVYVLSELTAFRRFDIKRLEEVSKDPESLEAEEIRLSGLELVKNPENKRLFILGKPGAGKTTFLKYLALQATNGVLDKVPIFVSLKEWDDSGLELFPFLVKQFEICNFPKADLFVKYVLNHGYAMVLFDGLDEVKQEAGKREHTISSLRDFSKQYWESQCLVTCRIAATEYSFEHFQYVELADFTDKQIDQYVSKWFKNEPKKLELFQDEFKKVENKGLREIARQPILLGLICIYFDETLVFAHRRVEIYEKALEALLIKWDSSRLIRRDEIYRGLSLGRKLEMYARIAARTFQDNEYFLPQDKLARYIVGYLRQLPNAEEEIDIDGLAVLKAIEAQHGIFSERADNIYAFSHLTFQEYFAAKYIVSDNSGRALRNLLSKDVITNDRWYEVIRFVASLQSDADLFFELFRKSLDEYIEADPVLVNFLSWSQRKASSIDVAEPPHAVCAIYCLLGATADRALYNDRVLVNYSDSVKAKNYIADSDDTFAFEAISDFIVEVARMGNTPLHRALHAIHNSSLDINKYINKDETSDYLYLKQPLLLLFTYLNAFLQRPVVKPNYVIDISLLYLLQFALLFKRISHDPILNWVAPQFKTLVLRLQALSSSVGQSQLGIALAELAHSLDQPSENDWLKFASELEETMQKASNIGHYWGFDATQHRKLASYFNVNILLYECLQHAVVSERQSIVSNLLLTTPPNNSFNPTPR
jgi:hypothetical protein